MQQNHEWTQNVQPIDKGKNFFKIPKNLVYSQCKNCGIITKLYVQNSEKERKEAENERNFECDNTFNQ